MAVELAHPDHHARCVIGRHRLDGESWAMFEVDGKPICNTHVVEIMAAMDNYHKSKVTENQVRKAMIDADRRRRAAIRGEDMRRKSGMQQSGFVYYVLIGEHVKIGYAADVQRRMRAYPPSAQLLAVHPGTMETERQVHEDFRAFLRDGREWFEPHPKLMEHIERVVSEFGEPGMFRHRYRKANVA